VQLNCTAVEGEAHCRSALPKGETFASIRERARAQADAYGVADCRDEDIHEGRVLLLVGGRDDEGIGAVLALP
jgi:hypothetical protein